MSLSRLWNWSRMARPTPPIRRNARDATRITAGTRPSPRRWTRATAGARMKASRTARARGISTARARERVATIRMARMAVQTISRGRYGWRGEGRTDTERTSFTLPATSFRPRASLTHGIPSARKIHTSPERQRRDIPSLALRACVAILLAGVIGRIDLIQVDGPAARAHPRNRWREGAPLVPG